MRWFVALVGLCACSFQRSGPSGGGDDGDDDDGERVQLVDKDPGDFGGAIEDGEVTAWGTIEPAAFVVGGLRMRGFAGNNVDDNDTFEDVLAKSTQPLGQSYAQLPADWAGGRPRGLGLPANSDQFTLVLEGEVLLPMGNLELQVDADDRAIVQVALDRTTFGERLFARTAITRIPIIVSEPGWYPIRAVLGEQGGNARIVLAFVQGGITHGIGAERLRARVTRGGGLVGFAFADQGITTPVGETAVANLDAQFGAGAPPYDLDTGIDTFSVRYAGQVRIDAEGDYTFGVDKGSDLSDGYRVFVDGALVASHWASAPDLPAGTVELQPGWHDLVVDYTENVGNAQVTLTMTGPGASGPIPTERLRPAVARGLTASKFDIATTIALSDPGTTPVPLAVLDDPNMVIDWVDYFVNISNHPLTNLAIAINDCMGEQPLPLTPQPMSSFFYYSADVRCQDQPPGPGWELRITDSAAGNLPNQGVATANLFGAVVAFRGGPRAPFATRMRYTSPPRPTPGAQRIVKVALTAALGAATFELAVRTGADAITLDAAPWKVIANDTEIDVAGGELMQYRVTVNSDGWAYPAIDQVAIDYVVP